jgi:hypothetical protein
VAPKGFADIWVRSPESYMAWREAKRKFVVEGAKKSAWLVKHLDSDTIGITGCWSWSHNHKLLPQIRDGLRSGDLVTVILDGDIATKPDVAKAAGSLAAQLKALGCVAEFIQLPQGPNGEKVGLDDWGVAQPKRKPPVWRSLLGGLPRVDIAALPVSEHLTDLGNAKRFANTRGMTQDEVA